MSEVRPTVMPASINPDAIPTQRATGWPDFHPEDYCHRCGQRNPCWVADSETWAVVSAAYLGEPSHAGVLCPTCAAELYGQPDGEAVIWQWEPCRLDEWSNRPSRAGATEMLASLHTLLDDLNKAADYQFTRRLMIGRVRAVLKAAGDTP